MAVNEELTRRVRALLAGRPDVIEKRMFRGITFMVDGKMCVSVGDDRIMCRIDPERHAEAVRRPGCRTVEMGGRPYPGFVYVDGKALRGEKELRAWVEMALEFNPRAKASKGAKAAKPAKTAKPVAAPEAARSAAKKSAGTPAKGARAKSMRVRPAPAGKPAARKAAKAAPARKRKP
jgi:TfoX/Sxy family transcriptional regulator of competence genes